MKAFMPDVNVWVALTIHGHGHHARATDWLQGVKRQSLLYFTRPTQTGLLRLLTTQQVLAGYQLNAFTNRAAWQLAMDWIALDYVDFAAEPPRLEAPWAELASIAQASPKLWNDAYLAAFAVRSGFCLVTFDSGFKQFKGLDLLVLK